MMIKEIHPRKGCLDIWNAFMVQGSIFSPESDIPFCPCISDIKQLKLIAYDDAKSIYKKEIKAGNINFYEDAYIHFYIDDQKFDGKQNSIWFYPDKALEIIKHFAGIITPDFSTYNDFPDPIKRYNTYRMRSFGYWIGTFGISVINNVRWGSEETWSYCFDGIPKNSIVCIGTVGSGLKKKDNRELFEKGFKKMIEFLNPKTIIIYGSVNYPFILDFIKNGKTLIHFQSKTDLNFKKRKENEQA